ncbi:hypothetical protein BJP34_01405 [Moorena producens PAL-8-15-08-1]|uniref:Uncharacterized protein n=1 Tax=Moorena producens PAL-8-15-08-1 TaxID=1458985 RepID=A0A1D8TL18_9CYAN|nr:SUMF1/EgtB/PvdO family nonheme iron enzyme [Moorena producens]AOW98272.1 hypothetical protein BJP34_01405 [Moorena producens PAL-8-15-08-1]
MNTGHTLGYLLKKINEALCSAFPDKTDLEMMVLFELNINLNEVASGGNLKAIVHKLIMYCQAYNQLEELIDRALKQNQNNAKLKAIEQNFKITTSLINILIPLEKKLLKQMQKSYRDCCPDCQNKNPNTFYEILENLDHIHIHQRNNDEKFIVKFVGHLLVNGNIPESDAEQLKQWLEKNANDISNLLVYKQTAEPKGLKQFSFQVVTVNRRGAIINRESQQADYFTQDLGNGVDLDMVYIPAGTFLMGSPETERGSDETERPQHQVIILPFFLGKYQVTQAQWQAVAKLPKVNRDLDPDPSYFKGKNRPVEQVSWYDAVEFCDRLSQYTGRKYRLPSEAEWEYACRARTTTPFHYGETIRSKLANYGASSIYAEEAKGEFREETTPVGSFPPNGFGLYDMHGNVWEWCGDPWHDNYEGAPTDGSIWTKYNNHTDYYIVRGGSWYDLPRYCRSASRNFFLARELIFSIIGFRVARGVA